MLILTITYSTFIESVYKQILRYEGTASNENPSRTLRYFTTVNCLGLNVGLAKPEGCTADKRVSAPCLKAGAALDQRILFLEGLEDLRAPFRVQFGMRFKSAPRLLYHDALMQWHE